MIGADPYQSRALAAPPADPSPPAAVVDACVALVGALAANIAHTTDGRVALGLAWTLARLRITSEAPWRSALAAALAVRDRFNERNIDALLSCLTAAPPAMHPHALDVARAMDADARSH